MLTDTGTRTFLALEQVRMHGNAEDEKRKCNRTEHFRRLYERRNDAESINRALDDIPLRHHARHGDPPLPIAA